MGSREKLASEDGHYLRVFGRSLWVSIAVVCSVTLSIEPGSQCSGLTSGKSGVPLPPAMVGFWDRPCWLTSLIGVEIMSNKNLSGITFHMSVNRRRSTMDVRTLWPKICQDLATRCSAAFVGACLKTCSAYLARKWSRPESILVKKSSSLPDNAWKTASRFVPQVAQNLRSIKLSLPQVGQNISETPLDPSSPEKQYERNARSGRQKCSMAQQQLPPQTIERNVCWDTSNDRTVVDNLNQDYNATARLTDSGLGLVSD